MYYLKDSRLEWPELVYIFVFLYYLPYALGYYLGFDLKNKSWVLWFLWILGLLFAEGWLVFKFYDRYVQVGTYDQFLANTGANFLSFKNPLALIFNGCFGAMVLYYFYVFSLFRRTQRKTLSL